MDIVVIVENRSCCPIRTSLVYALRGYTGLSVNEVRERITAGAELHRFTLYHNDHDEVSSALLELVNEVSKCNTLRLTMYELQEGKSLDAVDTTIASLTLEQLQTQLQAHQQGLTRMRELDELGHR